MTAATPSAPPSWKPPGLESGVRKIANAVAALEVCSPDGVREDVHSQIV